MIISKGFSKSCVIISTGCVIQLKLCDHQYKALLSIDVAFERVREGCVINSSYA